MGNYMREIIGPIVFNDTSQIVVLQQLDGGALFGDLANLDHDDVAERGRLLLVESAFEILRVLSFNFLLAAFLGHFGRRQRVRRARGCGADPAVSVQKRGMKTMALLAHAVKLMKCH